MKITRNLYYVQAPKETRSNEKAYWFDKITTAIFPQPQPVNIKNPKKILIARNDHIGDLILTTSIFREIKKRYPNSKLTVLANPIAKQVIEKNKNVDEIIPIGLFWRNKNLKSWIDYFKTLKKLRREKYDVGINARSSILNSFFFLFLPKAKQRIAYFNKGGGRIFLTNPALYKKMESATINIHRLANESLNLKSKNYWPEIITDKEDEIRLNNFFGKNKIKKYICVVPGTTTESKAWPIHRFNELIKRFNKKYPKHKIILVGGSDDKAKIDFLTKNKNCVPLINFNLRSLSLLFKKADVTIACDGGAKEIVWVVKANLIDLEGPVEIKIHKSLGGKNVEIIRHDSPCYPCDWSRPCARPDGISCMERITVDEVEKAISDFLKKAKTKK